jgi:hypothetical protein
MPDALMNGVDTPSVFRQCGCLCCNSSPSNLSSDTPGSTTNLTGHMSPRTDTAQVQLVFLTPGFLETMNIRIDLMIKEANAQSRVLS